jgi:hypothetical protein
MATMDRQMAEERLEEMSEEQLEEVRISKQKYFMVEKVVGKNG